MAAPALVHRVHPFVDWLYLASLALGGGALIAGFWRIGRRPRGR